MKLSRCLDQKRVLVVGDLILDTYVIGDVSRLSPEAPVPILKKMNEKAVLGGAGNVVSNLKAANQHVEILSVVGDDTEGNFLLEELNKKGIISSNIINVQGYKTTSKTRFVTSSYRHLLRVDSENDILDRHELIIELIAKFTKIYMDFEIILISDYLKGLMTKEFTQRIITMANRENIPVIIDVKDKDLSKYFGAFLLKPNLNELQTLTGYRIKTIEDIKAASISLRQKCNCKYILTTCGSYGMVLINNEDQLQHISSKPSNVNDVTGAGDTVMAYLGACLANNLSVYDSIEFANIAAGIKVSKYGASPIHIKEIDEWMENNQTIKINKHKIINVSSLGDIKRQNHGKKLVFTNGCFDILHAGHISLLRQASELGDYLIVGVNSDNSIRRIKGPKRPINTQSDRIDVLSAIEFVDYVVVFHEDTPIEIINKLQPDILVKGSDYDEQNIVGRDCVEEYGGKLVLIPLYKGRSTTNVIEKIYLKYTK